MLYCPAYSLVLKRVSVCMLSNQVLLRYVTFNLKMSQLSGCGGLHHDPISPKTLLLYSDLTVISVMNMKIMSSVW